MLKNYVASKEDLLKAIEIDESVPSSYFNLGYVYNCLDQPEAAEAAFEKVIELSPDDSLAYRFRAETRTKQQKWILAMEDFASQIAVDTN